MDGGRDGLGRRTASSFTLDTTRTEAELRPYLPSLPTAVCLSVRCSRTGPLAQQRTLAALGKVNPKVSGDGAEEHCSFCLDRASEREWASAELVVAQDMIMRFERKNSRRTRRRGSGEASGGCGRRAKRERGRQR